MLKRLRRPILYACIGFCILLALASIAGSMPFLFKDPGDARADLFASPLAIALWFLFVLLAVGAVTAYRSIRRSPIQLAVHLAPAFIVAGAMWGSPEGLDLEGRLLGSRPILPGSLIVGQGERESRVVEELPPDDPVHRGAEGGGETSGGGAEAEAVSIHGMRVRVLGTLPFEIELKRFWIERYDPEPALLFEWSVPGVGREGRPRLRTDRIPLAVGRTFEFATPGVAVTVLETLPSAREKPVPPKGILRFRKGRDLETRTVRGGDEVTLERFGLRVRIVRIFRNFKLGEGREGGTSRYDDAPGPPKNPACQIEVPGDGGAARGFVVFQHFGVRAIGRAHGEEAPKLPCDLSFRLIPGGGTVEPVPKGGSPAVRLRVACKRGSVEKWLLLDSEGSTWGVDLARELGHRGHALLAYRTPEPPPRDFLSEVVVWQGGEPRARKVVEVNHPLHYGGYHFYQSSYDPERLAWSLFDVVPDRGLPAVYLGFAGLGLALIALLYVRPALSRRKAVRRRPDPARFEALPGRPIRAIWIAALAAGGVAVAILVVRKIVVPVGPPLLPIQGILAVELELGLIAGILYLLGRARAGRCVFAAAFAVGILSFVLRWIAVDHVPMQNMFEVMLTLAACVFPISALLSGPLRVPGEWFDPVLAAILLVPASFIFDPQPGKLMPALQSPLFLPHVAVYMLAYAAMFKAANLGFLALGRLSTGGLLAWTSVSSTGGVPWGARRRIVRSRAEAKAIERGGYQVARLGFPLLAAGLLLGAWWAKIAWGDYWSWDPKELWSLASWLAYVVYFHIRILTRRRRVGLSSALLVTGGFVVLCTLLWVNLSKLFAGGLHSYAS